MNSAEKPRSKLPLWAGETGRKGLSLQLLSPPPLLPHLLSFRNAFTPETENLRLHFLGETLLTLEPVQTGPGVD